MKHNHLMQISSILYDVTVIKAAEREAKEKYRGMFEIQKSGNNTSSGEIGLDIRTHASPKVGQGQVSGRVETRGPRMQSGIYIPANRGFINDLPVITTCSNKIGPWNSEGYSDICQNGIQAKEVPMSNYKEMTLYREIHSESTT